MKKKISTLALLIILLLSKNTIVHAQDIQNDPIQIGLIIAEQAIHRGEVAEAEVIINNFSPYQVNAIIKSPNNKILSIVNLTQNQIAIAPHGSYTQTIEIEGKSIGETELIILVEYSWTDSTSKNAHTKSVSVNTDPINVTGFVFDWPNYLIPLILGFILSQFSTWILEQRKFAHEEKLKLEQTIGITLANLNIIQKGLERKETISFSMWEDLVLKGNLYPYLVKVGNKLKQKNFEKRITDLVILISEYNSKRENGHLSEDFIIDLSEEVNNLILTIKKIY